MYTGKLVFAQLMGHLSLHTFRRCVARYSGKHKVRRFTCHDQYLCMDFAQLTYRESLRDVEACLRTQRSKLYHMGISSAVSCSTLADANETRDWRIHADFAQTLIAVARKLYAGDDFGVELSQTVYAFDAATIDLCLRANNLFRRLYSPPVDTSSGLICDQTIRLTGKQAATSYSHKLRRVAFRNLETGKRLAVLTNNFDLPALTPAQLYRCRWQIELFFKCIKQHLRIKAFYGTSENAVRSQIWIAVSVYVLIAIVKKRLAIKASLYTMLQFLSLAPVEKMPKDKAFFDDDDSEQMPSKINQLNLFD